MATFKQKIEEYQKTYGSIPTEYGDRLLYLCESLRLSDKDDAFITKMVKRLKGMKRTTYKFTLYMVPEPTPRPRTSFNSRVFYVKGAKDNNNLFRDIIESIETVPLITTATEIDIKSYLPMPKAMNRMEKFFAELGFIRVTTTPDWDNLAKAYCDMIQKNLLLNDSLIWKGTSSKYYSVKPRIEMTITFDNDYDCSYNRKKVEQSKFYQTDETGRIDDSLDTILKLR